MRKKGYIILGIVFALILAIIIASLIWYNIQIGKPNKNNSEESERIVEIKSGTSTNDIIKLLKQNDIIRSELASKIYIGLNEVNNLQAGKYSFTGNEKLSEVIETISAGKVMDETITITFLEGKNMRSIASTIAEKTNNTSNDVYKLLENK